MTALPPRAASRSTAVSTSATSGAPAQPAGPALAQAKRRFLHDGIEPGDLVPASIVRSWARCAAFGLDSDRQPRLEALTSSELGRHHERAEGLCRVATAELDLLHHDLGQGEGVVVLADAGGLVLDRRGRGSFADAAARVALRPGVAWSEAATGTNAIGTALAERRDISVVGSEHFFEANRVLSCSALPILDGRGDILGVLDLTHPVTVHNTHALALLKRAVGVIEHRLFAAWARDLDLVRLHADPAELGGAREGLLAFRGDRLVGANRAGLAFVDRDWAAIDRATHDDLFADRRGRLADDGRLRTTGGRLLFGRLEERRPTPPPAARREVSVPAPAILAAVPPADAGEAPIWSERVTLALKRATRLVDADVPVLIQGETGAGKEVFARALHAAGSRRDRPFVAVNCAALPEGLIEAELFGYEEGAFTGARRRGAKGLMREADGGILFLDEIGDMPLALQSRLLRALQEREVTPLGGGRPIKVSFSLVCATHRSLPDLVARGEFRQDLYFRIAQYTVGLDPLRAHPDLPGLVDTLWRRFGGPSDVTLSRGARDALAGHDWPGNWRQLVATLRTLAVLAEPGERLDVDALPADITAAGGAPAAGTVLPPAVTAPAAAVADEPVDLDTLTRAAMQRALERAGGNVSRAAASLGIHRSTFYRRWSVETSGADGASTASMKRPQRSMASRGL